MFQFRQDLALRVFFYFRIRPCALDSWCIWRSPFFISYNEVQGKKFKSLGFGSRQRTLALVEEAHR
jgi:hypothetical protein